MNATLGLFIVNEFGEYLDRDYTDLTTYILIFALKWFSSIALALCLILLITVGNARECFRADSEEIFAIVIGMAFPTYIFCVVLQQIYATGYGIWFFQTLWDGDEVEAGTPNFSTMNGDCL